MLQVKDYQTVGILLCAGDADAVAATTRSNIGGVGTDRDNAVLGADQTRGLGGVLIDKIHVAVGRVIFLVGE